MTSKGRSSLRLPSDRLPKGKRYMRALRRAALNYWYATLEDPEAAYIEASIAAFVVNVLDEAVFEAALGGDYRTWRARDRLGKVVTGLELVRNCEVHAPVVFDDLLVERQRVGVPLSSGGQSMRVVLTWAAYPDLPVTYRDLPAGSSSAQVRARGEAQHGYREAVQDRSVMETIFDATAFFQEIEPKLVEDEPPETRWAFAELPDTDPSVSAPRAYFIARPMGLDRWEVELPDIACRWWDRRRASWGATDTYLKEEVKRAKKRPPVSETRQVVHLILDDTGTLVGYSGVAVNDQAIRFPTWAERSQQVWRDVKNGYRYFIEHNAESLDLVSTGHNHLQAPDETGDDRLQKLLPATEMSFDIDRLTMAEEYPDLYLVMRRGYG